MAGLKLHKVTKRCTTGLATVSDFSIDIEDREFTVFAGPSGCGKSTILRMIAGLEDISEGELYIDDKLMNGLTPKERDIAMVFQSCAIYPDCSVYENLSHGLKLRKVPTEEIEKRISEAAGLLSLAELLDSKPNELTDCQKQLISLGRAIVREPKVLLMDEPFSNLNQELRGQMRTEIAKLHKHLQITFVYVTNDSAEAMALGTRIVVINDGTIQQTGSPDDLYNNPKNMFVASFIGSPHLNKFQKFDTV